MKTEWDYTNLADAYLKRPDYAQGAIDAMLQIAKLDSVPSGELKRVCDVGAGAAHLTLMLAKKGFEISAVEPNDAMRANGIARTQAYKNVKWYEGIGEQTGMKDGEFDLVTFGSSFGVCDRQLALKETKRILKENGWFACMWNHRDLEDPLQKKIEDLIKSEIPGYRYGTRREDQTEVIRESGLFEDVQFIESDIRCRILAEDFIEGWKSHGTVQRQAPEKFALINDKIREIVTAEGSEYIIVPYTTRVWMARAKSNV